MLAAIQKSDRDNFRHLMPDIDLRNPAHQEQTPEHGESPLIPV